MTYTPTTSRATLSDTADDGPTERREQILKRQITGAVEELAKELQQGKSERLLALLNFSSRFRRYSPGNQILIWLQCPNATHVAGFKAWAEMGEPDENGERGYRIRAGAKAIRILAPRTYKKVDETSGDETTRLYFRSVPVFDVSQLNEDDLAKRPIPQFFTDLGSDEETEALCTRVVAAMEQEGIRVEQRDDLPGSVQGYSAGGYVAIRALSSRNRIRTLVHEWAHERLHHTADKSGAATRDLRECHAEASAYVVLAHFGIHNDYSADYLQNWGNTAETLFAELAAIQQAASHIIDALRPANATVHTAEHDEHAEQAEQAEQDDAEVVSGVA